MFALLNINCYYKFIMLWWVQLQNPLRHLKSESTRHVSVRCSRLLRYLDMSIDYCVTESDYHARSVAKWLGYHRVVTGRPHQAQTQTNRPLKHEYHQVRSQIGRTRRLSRGTESNG